MTLKRTAILALAFTAVVACKQKKAEVASDCPRSMTSAPPEFSGNAANVAGAVKTSACTTVAVGADRDGQPVIMRFGADNKVDATFTQPTQPFLNSYPGYKFAIMRLAVMPSGYLALGSYTNPAGASEFFAFRLNESGFLDTTFGPHADGVIRDSLKMGTTVNSVSPPNTSESVFDITVNYTSATGRTYDRPLRIAYSGNDPMVPTAYPVPTACSNINLLTAGNDGVTYQLSQNGCTNIVWTARGAGVNEAINILLDGTINTNAFFGQFAMHIENLTPVVQSHNSLGNVQLEYMSLVTGTNTLCGDTVDPSRTYLALSTKKPSEDDGMGCRYLGQRAQ